MAADASASKSFATPGSSGLPVPTVHLPKRPGRQTVRLAILAFFIPPLAIYLDGGSDLTVLGNLISIVCCPLWAMIWALCYVLRGQSHMKHSRPFRLRMWTPEYAEKRRLGQEERARKNQSKYQYSAQSKEQATGQSSSRPMQPSQASAQGESSRQESKQGSKPPAQGQTQENPTQASKEVKAPSKEQTEGASTQVSKETKEPSGEEIQEGSTHMSKEVTKDSPTDPSKEIEKTDSGGEQNSAAGQLTTAAPTARPMESDTTPASAPSGNEVQAVERKNADTT